ncbi:hypothetical protein PBV87_08760 [Niameybacter massiliensis]|uniref:Uncharacterized protein n=1 Tax=Holtiella tumoricola TaxID=3018743 RepID=A0AA42DMS6_9FIRM|nr:hypothetical protein [Holtiella tumoricola]MDA3731563.1 hypothetical protein [Holtiella tumoricola]
MQDIRLIEEKLKSYKLLKVEVDNLEIDLEGYRPSYGSGATEVYAGGNKNNNPIPGRSTARCATSLIEDTLMGRTQDLDEKYFRLLECRRLIKKIDNILETLSDRDRKLIEGFYIKSTTLLELSLELNMNPDYLSALKRSILEKYFYTLS